jgi:hypothetical protein
LKTYNCACGQLIFFQNVACLNCGRELGFLPEALVMSSIEPAANGGWKASGPMNGVVYQKCRNYGEGVCNWMVSEEAEAFCISCRLNEIIPDLSLWPNRDLWAATELAKRRVIYGVLQLKLPLARKTDDPQRGIAFRFLSDTTNPDGTLAKVLTGHDNGTITLNTAEADDASREKVRHQMHEPYRTLVGHFRHEIGHYYWDRLVCDTNFIGPFRALFGDERADYGAALQRHYQTGAPVNWQENFISAYATSHPWEDWAESWAHFLHIQDSLEVAQDFGLVGKPLFLSPQQKRQKPWLSLKQDNFRRTIRAWAELSVALNSINRSMGLPDLYPFVLSAPVVEKLRFVSDVIAAPRA